MNRTEQCFRKMHERISQLEDRQDWHAPSDEQVERVLRKILAERFSDGTLPPIQYQNIMKEADYFVEDARRQPAPLPVLIDPASLMTDPDSVPSKAYADTINLLDKRIARFPNFDHRNHVNEGTRDVKRNYKLGQINGSGCV
jgi:hypothetical protein